MLGVKYHPWILLHKPQILSLRNNPRIAQANLGFGPFADFVVQTSDSQPYSTDYYPRAPSLHVGRSCNCTSMWITKYYFSIELPAFGAAANKVGN